MNNFDQVIGGFGRRFVFARHVVTDVVLHQLGHQTVDGAARGGEALENVGAGCVVMEGPQDGFKLADNLFGAIDEVELFAR